MPCGRRKPARRSLGSRTGSLLIVSHAVFLGLQTCFLVLHLCTAHTQSVFPATWQFAFGAEINWEFGINIYTLVYVKSVSNSGLLYSTGNYPQYPFFKKLFFIEEWLLHNVVLVSAIHRHISAISTRMSPPSWTSLPPLEVFTQHRVELLCIVQQIPTGCLFYIW